MPQQCFRKECTLIMYAYINRPLLSAGNEATASNKCMQRRPQSEFHIVARSGQCGPLMRGVRLAHISFWDIKTETIV
jgi:hypothetical protein